MRYPETPESLLVMEEETLATLLLTAAREVRPDIEGGRCPLVDHVTAVEECSIVKYEEQGLRCRCS